MCVDYVAASCLASPIDVPRIARQPRPPGIHWPASHSAIHQAQNILLVTSSRRALQTQISHGAEGKLHCSYTHEWCGNWDLGTPRPRACKQAKECLSCSVWSLALMGNKVSTTRLSASSWAIGAHRGILALRQASGRGSPGLLSDYIAIRA